MSLFLTMRHFGVLMTCPQGDILRGATNHCFVYWTAITEITARSFTRLHVKCWLKEITSVGMGSNCAGVGLTSF